MNNSFMKVTSHLKEKGTIKKRGQIISDVSVSDNDAVVHCSDTTAPQKGASHRFMTPVITIEALADKEIEVFAARNKSISDVKYVRYATNSNALIVPASLAEKNPDIISSTAVSILSAGCADPGCDPHQIDIILDEACNGTSAKEESFIISQNGSIIRIDQNGFTAGHGAVDKTGHVVMTEDSSVERSSSDFRKKLSDVVFTLRNPVIVNDMKQAEALLIIRLRSVHNSGDPDVSVEIYRDFENELYKKLIEIMARPDFDSNQHVDKKVQSQLTHIGSLIDSARITQTLRRAAFTAEDFDERYLYPTIVPEHFTEKDIFDVIDIADQNLVDLERYRFSAQRLMSQMKTFHFQNTTYSGYELETIRDQLRRNRRALIDLIHEAPDKTSYIQRRMAELAVDTIGCSHRNGYKTRNVFDERNFISQIERELKSKAKRKPSEIVDSMEKVPPIESLDGIFKYEDGQEK